MAGLPGRGASGEHMAGAPLMYQVGVIQQFLLGGTILWSQHAFVGQELMRNQRFPGGETGIIRMLMKCI